MNPTDYLRLGIEQHLRELPDDEFSDLIQRVRPADDRPAGDGRTSFVRNLFQDGND